MHMLDILLPYVQYIVMVEQPFPVELTLPNGGSTEEHEQWSQVKQAYNKAGFPIFADESMRVVGDIPRLGQHCAVRAAALHVGEQSRTEDEE